MIILLVFLSFRRTKNTNAIYIYIYIFFSIDGLLNMLSQILMHRPLRHPGMPKNAMIAPTPAGGKSFIFHLNLYLYFFHQNIELNSDLINVT